MRMFLYCIGSLRKFASVLLYDLLLRIVEQQDSDALNELHSHRKVFRVRGKQPLLLIEFILLLKGSSTDSFYESAYDQVIAKFSSFPLVKGGVDCRNYYRAVLNQMDQIRTSHPLERDLRLGDILQALVAKHFKLALKEAQRSHGHYSRYLWKLPTCEMTLQFPRSISGSQRSTWLSEHYPNTQHISVTDKVSIQTHIMEVFADSITVSLTDTFSKSLPDDSVLMPWEAATRFPTSKLANAVAQEKSDRILEQRPAIRKIGSDSLHALILEVFQGVLGEDDFSDTQLASTHGISKAALSRFAGKQWSGDLENMPDLWRNTLNVISHSPRFEDILPSLHHQLRLCS